MGEIGEIGASIFRFVSKVPPFNIPLDPLDPLDEELESDDTGETGASCISPWPLPTDRSESLDLQDGNLAGILQLLFCFSCPVLGIKRAGIEGMRFDGRGGGIGLAIALCEGYCM